MAGIHVYNRTKETHLGDNNFQIFRPSVLGNPYTDIWDRETKAMFRCRTREEAIQKYSDYFDIMYGSNIEFTKEIDKIYEKYKNGEDVYLECYCNPKSCHGDVIAEKLQKKLIKERFLNRRK